jgi:hypothetical protein
MTLEKAIAYIEDDELVEVTPKSIRGNAEELPKTLADCPESCFSMIVSFFEFKYERIVENLRSQLEAYLVLPQIGFRLPNVPFEA